MTHAEGMERLAEFFEIIGALILLAGLVVAAGLAIRSLARSRDAAKAHRVLRQAFGGAILLGLEVLVAADLVRTVAVAPTLENVVTLVHHRLDSHGAQLLTGDRDRRSSAVAAGLRHGCQPCGTCRQT